MKNQNFLKFLLVGLMTASFLMGFLPMIQKLGIRWNGGDSNYCYLIIPFFIYLCWEKKEKFRFGQFSWDLRGILLLLVSILAMTVGELSSVETLVYIGIWANMVSVLFILYGTRLRLLLFELLILAFIVPLPPFINRMLTFNLKLAASTFSVTMLRLCGVSVVQDGNIIDLGITQMQVVDACSGLRFFVPMILIALLIGNILLDKSWKKILLLVIVPPLSILVNALRIFITGMLTVWGYPELADNFFHDFSGVAVFLMAGVILFLIAYILKGFGKPTDLEPDHDPGGKPVKPFVPVSITLIVCVFFTASGYAIQKLPSTSRVPTRQPFNEFPMKIGEWTAKRSYIPEKIMAELWADDYINATYVNQKKETSIHLFIPFYNYQSTRHTAHAPQSCMLGSGWALIGEYDHFFTTSTGEKLPIKTDIWEKGDSKILGTYFFFQRGRVITSPWLNKYWLIRDAFTKKRTDGALVRAEMFLASGQDMEDSYRTMEAFIEEVFEILPAYVPR